MIVISSPPSPTTLLRIEAVKQATIADGVRTATAALGDCRNPMAIPCLLQLLEFNNPGAAIASVVGLIRIGEEAVNPLVNNLDTPNTGRGPGPCVPWLARGCAWA